jgi:CheY-like chemotaxis protein
MEESRSISNEVASGSYDAADRPFDFLMEQGETALICESDPVARDRICNDLKSLDYAVTEVESVRDALKKMRFHVFDLILINEGFDAANGAHELLKALEVLDIFNRRQMFVALIGDSFRTMDSMAAFRKSVNLVINKGDLKEIGAIIKHGVQENKVFYHTYTEVLRNKGRL